MFNKNEMTEYEREVSKRNREAERAMRKNEQPQRMVVIFAAFLLVMFSCALINLWLASNLQETATGNEEQVLRETIEQSSDVIRGWTDTIMVDTDGDGIADSEFSGIVVVGEQFEQSLREVARENPPPVEAGLDGGVASGYMPAPR
ncbi:MAG: hypothetical protein ACK5MU_02110 [Candidatus Saccharimonadales bacterium]